GWPAWRKGWNPSSAASRLDQDTLGAALAAVARPARGELAIDHAHQAVGGLQLARQRDADFLQVLAAADEQEVVLRVAAAEILFHLLVERSPGNSAADIGHDVLPGLRLVQLPHQVHRATEVGVVVHLRLADAVLVPLVAAEAGAVTEVRHPGTDIGQGVGTKLQPRSVAVPVALATGLEIRPEAMQGQVGNLQLARFQALAFGLGALVGGVFAKARLPGGGQHVAVMLVRPAADIARFGRLGRLAGIESQPLHHAAVGGDPAQRRRAAGHADAQPVVVAPVHFHHFVTLARPDFESVRVALLADGLEGLAALAGDEAALG